MVRKSLKVEDGAEAGGGAAPRGGRGDGGAEAPRVSGSADPRLEWWPAAKLKGNPLNWRSHSARQRAALDGVMDKVGWAGAVIVNIRTGHVIDGHLRMERALERPGELVPVLVYDLPEDQEHLALATHDALARWAEGDAPQYGELAGEVAGAFEDLGEDVSAVMAEVRRELAGDDARRAVAAKNEAAGYWVRVDCGSEAGQQRLYELMQAEGRACRVLTL